MKKGLAIFLIGILTMIPISAQASTEKVSKEKITMVSDKDVLSKVEKPEHMTKTQLNEYEMYKDLKKASDNELLAYGWNSEKIESFRDYEFSETIKERSKLSVDELKTMGYTDEKINILKTTTDWTDAKLLAVASTLYAQGGAGRATNNNRNWEFYFEWGWDTLNAKPSFVGEDIIGLRWIGSRNGTVAVPSLIKSNSTVVMSDIDNGYKTVYTSSMSLDKVDLNAAERSFRGYNVMANKRCYATSGYTQFTVSNTQPMETVTMAFKYGHATNSLVTEPSISLEGVSVSFSFTSGIKEMARIIETYKPDGTIYNG